MYFTDKKNAKFLTIPSTIKSFVNAHNTHIDIFFDLSKQVSTVIAYLALFYSPLNNSNPSLS